MRTAAHFRFSGGYLQKIAVPDLEKDPQLPQPLKC
jgi:hypothetical protein